MGFFSWKTSDTNRSIANIYSCRKTFPVYLLQPNGKHILETEYSGYGCFGGEDAYALVARWNKPELCNGDENHDRSIGIEIACYDAQNAKLKYPLKFVEHVTNYEDAEPSMNCPEQGFFYDDEENEEDTDYYDNYYEEYD